MGQKTLSTRRIAYISLLVALSAVGSYLKIPSLTGTPALDSFPGFLAALLLGPADGAWVAFLGHLFTALTVGFPLTVPLHLLVACGMAAVASIFAFISVYSLPLSAGVAVALNSVLLPALFLPLPGFGRAFFLAMFVPLLVASGLNVGIAVVILSALKPVFPHSWLEARRRRGKDAQV